MRRDPIVLAIALCLLVLLILHFAEAVTFAASWPVLAIIAVVLLVLYLR